MTGRFIATQHSLFHSADTAPRVVTLVKLPDGDSVGESVTGLAPAEIDTEDGINKLGITAGAPGGTNIFFVEATNTFTTLASQGPQWVFVQDQGTVGDIDGTPFVGNSTSSTFLSVDDSRDPDNHTVTLSNLHNPFTGVPVAGIIDGLAPA
jgi:hypothetical protein